MSSILTSIVAPVFALALIGAFLAKIGILNQERTAGLIAFVIHAALPALLFRSLSNGLAEPEELMPVAAYATATLLMFFGSNLFARRFLRKEKVESSLFAMGSSFSNSVMVGVPIVYATNNTGSWRFLLLWISRLSFTVFGHRSLTVVNFSSSGQHGLQRTLTQDSQGSVAALPNFAHYRNDEFEF